MAQRLPQQRESADDVGLDEVGGIVDRAIDMGFRGEVHHIVRPVLVEQLAQRRAVADIDLREPIPITAGRLRN